MNQLNRIDTDTLSRALIGFDSMFNNFERRFANSISANYPPHNVIKTGENTLIIEVAVAGFAEGEIDINVNSRQLAIAGEQKRDDDASHEYLHRGIATRAFHKTIQLADTIEVGDAVLENGILRVFLQNVIPEEKKPKKIPIKYAGKKQLLTE